MIDWTSLILPISKAFALLELWIFHAADAVCGFRLLSWLHNTYTEEGLSFPFIDFSGMFKYMDHLEAVFFFFLRYLKIDLKILLEAEGILFDLIFFELVKAFKEKLPFGIKMSMFVKFVQANGRIDF